MLSFSSGSLGTSIFDMEAYLVGASGGVYALLAAHLANIVLVCKLVLLYSWYVSLSAFFVCMYFGLPDPQGRVNYCHHLTLVVRPLPFTF